MKQDPRHDTLPGSGKAGQRGRYGRLAALGLAGGLGLAIAAGDGLSPIRHMVTPPAVAQDAVVPFANAPASFNVLVKQVRPAVVSIQVSSGGKKTSSRRRRGGRNFPDLPDDHPLNEFFKKFGGGKGQGFVPRMPTRAQGSGFIISPDG